MTAASSRLVLSPRTGFAVAIPPEAFLAYRYVPWSGPDHEPSAIALWAHLGPPVLAVVGEELREGMAVYRVRDRDPRRFVRWDWPTDPGIVVGHLVASTIEEVKQLERIAPVTVPVCACGHTEGAHVGPRRVCQNPGCPCGSFADAGRRATFDELPSTIGDRKAWRVATDHPVVRLSAALEEIPEARGGRRISLLTTRDLDLSDVRTSAQLAERRLRELVGQGGGGRDERWVAHRVEEVLAAWAGR